MRRAGSVLVWAGVVLLALCWGPGLLFAADDGELAGLGGAMVLLGVVVTFPVIALGFGLRALASTGRHTNRAS